MKKLIFLILMVAGMASAQNPFITYDSSSTLLKWYDETGTQRWGPTTSAGGDTFVSEPIRYGPYVSLVDSNATLGLSYFLIPGDTVHYTVAIQIGRPVGNHLGFYAPGWAAGATGAVNSVITVGDSIVSVLAGQTYPGTGGSISFANSLWRPLGFPEYFRWVLLPYKVGDATMNGAETTLFRRFRFFMAMPNK